MSRISTRKISVLVNSSQTTYFEPTCSIRQGDPMSSYIFIMCMELLFIYINHQVHLTFWDPIKVSIKGPQSSYLFYADDLTLMAQANERTINNIQHPLSTFCSISEQKVNNTKSKILFLNNCPPTRICCCVTQH